MTELEGCAAQFRVALAEFEGDSGPAAEAFVVLARLKVLAAARRAPVGRRR